METSMILFVAPPEAHDVLQELMLSEENQDRVRKQVRALEQCDDDECIETRCGNLPLCFFRVGEYVMAVFGETEIAATEAMLKECPNELHSYLSDRAKVLRSLGYGAKFNPIQMRAIKGMGLIGNSN